MIPPALCATFSALHLTLISKALDRPLCWHLSDWRRIQFLGKEQGRPGVQSTSAFLAVQPWTSYLNSLCLHCSSVKWAQTGSTSHGRQAGSQGLHAYTVPSTQGWPSLGDEPTRHPLPLRDKDISTCYQALPICSLIGDRAVRRKTFHRRTPARDGICPQEQKYQVGIFFFLSA